MSAMLGILLGILGGIIDNVGVTVQKLAHRKVYGTKTGAYLRSPTWLIGLAMYLSGNIVNAVGLGMAPQSVFATLGALSLVTNTITSRFILKETVNRIILMGTGLIIVGAILTVVFGAHTDETLSLHELQEHASGDFTIFLLIITIMMILTYSGIQYLKKQERRAAAIIFSEDESESLSNTFDVSTPTTSMKLAQRSLFRQRILAVAFPVLAGMIGSFTQLFAKIVSVFIRNASDPEGDNLFNTGYPYIGIILVLSFGATQIHFLNMGLKDYDQLIVVPAFMVALETFSVVSGLVFWGNYATFTTPQKIIFPLGVLVSFAGVYTTTLGKQKHRDESDRANLVPVSLGHY